MPYLCLKLMAFYYFGKNDCLHEFFGVTVEFLSSQINDQFSLNIYKTWTDIVSWKLAQD